MIRNQRFSITVKVDLLEKLNTIAEKENIKRATLVAELCEKFVGVQDKYGHVIDKEMAVIDVHDLIADYIGEIELVMGDVVIKDLVYDKGTRSISGSQDMVVEKHVPWYKKIFTGIL